MAHEIKEYGFNIFFKVPYRYSLNDYKISFVNDREEEQGEWSKFAFFELTERPQDMEKISISSRAGLNFTDRSPIKIGYSLEIGAGSNVNIEGTKDSSVYFERLKIGGNKDLTIKFSPSDFCQLTKAQFDKALVKMPDITTIENNSNFFIDLSDKSLIKNLNNFCIRDGFKDFGRLDLTRARYIDVDSLTFCTVNKGSRFAFDCDFLKAYGSCITMRKSKLDKEYDPFCVLIKNINEKGLSCINLLEPAIDTYNSAYLTTKTEKLFLLKGEKRSTM